VQWFFARHDQAVLGAERPHVLDNEGMQPVKRGFGLICFYGLSHCFGDLVEIPFVRNRGQCIQLYNWAVLLQPSKRYPALMRESSRAPS
jgi:hypothetical protein